MPSILIIFATAASFILLLTFSLPGISFEAAFWKPLDLLLLARFYFKYFTEDLFAPQHFPA